MDFKFSVPVIPHNLSQNETVVQIAEVLDQLSNITEAVFQHVTKKLETDKNRLINISQRVDSAKDKINKLRGVKKAIQVFSSSQYPASDVYKEYVSVFHDIAPVEIKRHKVKLKNYASCSYEPLEKLQIYHVSDTCRDNVIENIANVPANVLYVNDLCAFEKDIYIANDSTKSPVHSSYIFEIDEAPHSISERSTLNKTVPQSQKFLYTPAIGEVPFLDVPLDLPDLPGIPDDLHYDNKEESIYIAPSLLMSSTVIEDLDLPNIDDTYKENLPLPLNVQELPEPPLPDEVYVSSEIPKPLVKDEEMHIHSEVDSQTKEEALQVHLTIEDKPKKELLAVTDVRSSLMEAIRNIGGAEKAKLKHVGQEKGNSNSAAKGGDLMSDLFNKLSMRRKGISGAKQVPHGTDSQLTLGRMAAMIPPPEPKNDVESTSNDEEDWE